MLRGSFIFPLSTRNNLQEIAKTLHSELSKKSETPVIFSLEELGFTIDRLKEYVTLNKLSEVIDILIKRSFELLKSHSIIIFTGLDIQPDEAVFCAMINRKLAIALGLPVIATSSTTSETTSESIKLGSRISILATTDSITAEIVDRLIEYKSEMISSHMAQFLLVKKASENKKKIILPEGNSKRILKAASEIKRLDFAIPIVLGNTEKIQTLADKNDIDISGIEIINPSTFPELQDYIDTYYELRKNKGMTIEEASKLMLDENYFGTMLVYKGYADGMTSGAIHTTAETIRPALQFIKTKPDVSVVSGAFFMSFHNRVCVFADCAVQPNPNADNLSEIAFYGADLAKFFDLEPKVAMISYSTGSSGKGEDVEKVIEATTLTQSKYPELLIDGPLQFDAAISPEVAKTKLPASKVAGQANVFVFPDLNTGNTTYKAVHRVAEDALAIGPILLGLNKPVNDLSRGCTVLDIINTVAITALQANKI